jgi:hypothetical protein
MSHFMLHQINHLGSDRLLNVDYIELRKRIQLASTLAEQYYVYLENTKNGIAQLDSKLMTTHVNKIIAANRSLWKILKLVPYEQKDQYKIEKQALIKTLKAQIVTQKQIEEDRKIQISNN